MSSSHPDFLAILQNTKFYLLEAFRGEKSGNTGSV